MANQTLIVQLGSWDTVTTLDVAFPDEEFSGPTMKAAPTSGKSVLSSLSNGGLL